MREPLWGPRPLPRLGVDAFVVGRWEPRSPSDLTLGRTELGTAVHRRGALDGDDSGVEEGAERLLLAYEELASNALRHGSAPVGVAVFSFHGSWLLDVSDAAGDRPPTLAVDRDPAQGGLGLYLVARISAGHGWWAAAGRKSVWAWIDGTGVPAPTARDAAEFRAPT